MPETNLFNKWTNEWMGSYTFLYLFYFLPFLFANQPIYWVLCFSCWNFTSTLLFAHRRRVCWWCLLFDASTLRFPSQQQRVGLIVHCLEIHWFFPFISTQMTQMLPSFLLPFSRRGNNISERLNDSPKSTMAIELLHHVSKYVSLTQGHDTRDFQLSPQTHVSY